MCTGCHNPDALPFEGGQEVLVEELMAQIDANPLLAGITLTGGEPFEQPKPFLELAEWARGRGLNIWAYSGYMFDELIKASPSEEAKELLLAVDVLVDGRFIEDQAIYDLKWRGSANQRIIDVPASLAANEVIELS